MQAQCIELQEIDSGNDVVGRSHLSSDDACGTSALINKPHTHTAPLAKPS